ncbi:MAG: AAA family ATPase [Chloroflexota bacterium]
MLVVFSGLPGAGKSALAEAAGRALGIPVFAKDWLEATVLSCGLTGGKENVSVGYELLTMLAERQLRLSQPAILDSVATFERIREQWRSLAARYNASFRAIECVCSDEALHRARLDGRQRGIPGWRELEWSAVERTRETYESWANERLIVDAINPLEANIGAVMGYLKDGN